MNLGDTLGPLPQPVNFSSTGEIENAENDRSSPVPRRSSVLDEPGLREDDTTVVRDQRISTVSRSYQEILKNIGEDPARQGSFLFSLIICSQWNPVFF